MSSGVPEKSRRMLAAVMHMLLLLRNLVYSSCASLQMIDWARWLAVY